MGFLVNFSPSGQGIESLMSSNMTCTCDHFSCQCFHSKLWSNPQTEQQPLIAGQMCHLITCFNSHPSDSFSCDDHCILSITIATSIILAAVLLCMVLVRGRYGEINSILDIDFFSFSTCRYEKKKAEEEYIMEYRASGFDILSKYISHPLVAGQKPQQHQQTPHH